MVRVFAPYFVLSVTAATFTGLDDNLAAIDDECLDTQTGSNCALSALQLRGERFTAGRSGGNAEGTDRDKVGIAGGTAAKYSDLGDITIGLEDDNDVDDAKGLEHNAIEVAHADPSMLDKINKKLSGMVAKINEALPQKLKSKDPLQLPQKKGKMHLNQLLGFSSMKIDFFNATNLSIQDGTVLLGMILQASWGTDFMICGNLGKRAALYQWGMYGGMGFGGGGYRPEWGYQMGMPMMPSPNYNMPGPPMMPPAAQGMSPPPQDASAQQQQQQQPQQQQQQPSCAPGRKTVSIALQGIGYRNENIKAFIDMKSKTITKFEVGAGKMTIQGARPQVNAGFIMRRIVTKKLTQKLPKLKAQMASKLAAKLDGALEKMLQKKCPIQLGKKSGASSQPGSQPSTPASQPSALASSSACSANPGCAALELTGDCCPNAAGVKLGCCS